MLFWEKLLTTLTALLNLIISIITLHSATKSTKNSAIPEEFSAKKDV